MPVTTDLRVIKAASSRQFGRKAWKRGSEEITVDGLPVEVDVPCNMDIVRGGLQAVDDLLTTPIQDLVGVDLDSSVLQNLDTALAAVGRPVSKDGEPPVASRGIFGGRAAMAMAYSADIVILYFHLDDGDPEALATPYTMANVRALAAVEVALTTPLADLDRTKSPLELVSASGAVVIEYFRLAGGGAKHGPPEIAEEEEIGQ